MVYFKEDKWWQEGNTKSIGDKRCDRVGEWSPFYLMWSEDTLEDTGIELALKDQETLNR